MTPRNRAFLRWAFIIVFLIIAPVIILSTAGYRFNFGTRRLERTGVIVVATAPTGASVSLNGRAVSTSTPARLTRVSPGTYRVRVEKVGFHAWEKEVTVVESQSLFLNDIVLLRDAPLTLVREQSNLITSAFSPDGRYAAVLSDERGVAELHVFNLKAGGGVLPYRAASGAAITYALSWSADSQHLYITRSSKTEAVYLWNTSEPLITTELDAVPPLEPGDPMAMLSKLPASSNARGAAWSSDGKRLLYWNDLELHVFDATANADELITRVSRSVTKASWYANDQLILYATEEGLSAVESGHEGARVTTPLAAMERIVDFTVSKPNDTAWLVGALGHQQGVFSLKLQ